MQSELPFFENPEDALRAAMQALGGAKQLGPRLWPDLTPDNAARRLLDALNPARSERLQLSQVMRVLAWAKDVGCHGPMNWICSEIGYDARPVSSAEEVDRMACVVEATAKTLGMAVAALERMQRARGVV